jgi:hypothetical protein
VSVLQEGNSVDLDFDERAILATARRHGMDRMTGEAIAGESGGFRSESVVAQGDQVIGVAPLKIFRRITEEADERRIRDLHTEVRIEHKDSERTVLDQRVEKGRAFLDPPLDLAALGDVQECHDGADQRAVLPHGIAPVLRREARPVGAPEDLVFRVTAPILPDGAKHAGLVHRVGLTVRARVTDQGMRIPAEQFAGAGVAKHRQTGRVAEREVPIEVETVDSLRRRVEEQPHLLLALADLLVGSGQPFPRSLELQVRALQPPDQHLAVFPDRGELRHRWDSRLSLPPGASRVPESAQDRFGSQRIPNESVRARPQSHALVGQRRVRAAVDDDPGILEMSAPANLIVQAIAIHPRHEDIRDDGVEPAGTEFLEGIHAVHGLYSLVPLRGERGREKPPVDLVVVDDQNPQGGVSRSFSPGGGAGRVATLSSHKGISTSSSETFKARRADHSSIDSGNVSGRVRNGR